ncbi:helix-turn-helix domain-containing protein [Allofrancisella frigidaquae]|nr:helix-turn-helix transcriptional regulator [Allofrancisella frigidaquae]
MSVLLKSPYEMAKDIAKRAQAKRLSLNLSQQTLSKVSGVSYGTLKKFERTGQISLESLLKIAIVLDEFEKFEQLFVKNAEEIPTSLDELLVEESTRKRGRK